MELPESRKLQILDPVPDWHGVRPMKYPKDLQDIRGPELIHNDLLYKQYGIMVCKQIFHFSVSLISP